MQRHVTLCNVIHHHAITMQRHATPYNTIQHATLCSVMQHYACSAMLHHTPLCSAIQYHTTQQVELQETNTLERVVQKVGRRVKSVASRLSMGRSGKSGSSDFQDGADVFQITDPQAIESMSSSQAPMPKTPDDE